MFLATVEAAVWSTNDKTVGNRNVDLEDRTSLK
jgi:hypothetical protein